MRLTIEQYEKLLRERPGLRPIIKTDCVTHSRKVAKLEPDPSNAPLGEKKLQGATETAIVRIISVRKNLLDTDNICAKFLIDLLRYSNILYDDNPESTTIETSQRKCGPKEEEHTQIEIDIYEKP